MVCFGCSGFSWASEKEHTESAAGKSSAAGRRREDLRIDLREPIRRGRRHGVFRRVHGFCDGALPGIFHPTILQRLPIDFLKIEITKTIEFFRELRAAGLELWHGGEAGGGSAGAIRKHFAQSFNACGGENHVLGNRNIEKIPLRAACATLFPSKGDLQESNISLIALRSDLLAEDRAYELKGLRLLSDAQKINLLRGVHRRARLHRSEFSGEQPKRLRHGHSQLLLRERVE